MKFTEQPFETEGHDLTGMASLDLHENQNLASLVSIIPGMDTRLYEPVALKLFVAKDGLILTLYAKFKNDHVTFEDNENQTTVRKFKVPLPLSDLFKYVKSFDLVVHEGKYDLGEIKVDRK